MEFLGDGQYVAPMIELGQFHSSYPAAPTYLYTIARPSLTETYPAWMGSGHGDDLQYVFGAPLTDGLDPFPSTYTRTEKMLAETVLRYVTNFIKTG